MHSITKQDLGMGVALGNNPDVPEIKNTLLSVEDINQVSGGHLIPPLYCKPPSGMLQGSWQQLKPCHKGSYFRHLGHNRPEDPI